MAIWPSSHCSSTESVVWIGGSSNSLWSAGKLLSKQFNYPSDDPSTGPHFQISNYLNADYFRKKISCYSALIIHLEIYLSIKWVALFGVSRWALLGMVGQRIRVRLKSDQNQIRVRSDPDASREIGVPICSSIRRSISEHLESELNLLTDLHQVDSNGKKLIRKKLIRFLINIYIAWQASRPEVPTFRRSGTCTLSPWLSMFSVKGARCSS